MIELTLTRLYTIDPGLDSNLKIYAWQMSLTQLCIDHWSLLIS